MWKGNMMTAGRRPSRTNRMPGEGRKREISGQLHILCNSGIGLGGCRIIRIMHAWLANTVVRRGGGTKTTKKDTAAAVRGNHLSLSSACFQESNDKPFFPSCGTNQVCD